MNVLDRLRGGLIVSVQARAGSALDNPQVLAAMALAAQESGAAGLRIQGVRNLQAVRARTNLPVIGLIKVEYDGFEPYITPSLQEVRAVLACGAEIVAFDATARPRPGGAELPAIVAAIHEGGALAMADCALAEEGRDARAAGADILATTLCGYTTQSRGTSLPALDLLRDLRPLGGFVICEGGVHAPVSARQALEIGADAVVVGTAITDTAWLVGQFVRALDPQRSWPA